MNVEILSPEKALFKGTAQAVTLPGESGSFSVHDQHAPLMSTLEKGTIVIDYGKVSIPIESGVVDVHQNQVTVLVQS